MLDDAARKNTRSTFLSRRMEGDSACRVSNVLPKSPSVLFNNKAWDLSLSQVGGGVIIDVFHLTARVKSVRSV